MTYNINHAFVADLVYSISVANEGAQYRSSDGSLWSVVLPSLPNTTEYQSTLFKNLATGEYAFTSRGTESNFGDLAADVQMGVGRLPDQLATARVELERAKETVALLGGDPASITLVGHSLGGAITQMLAAENPQLNAVTFNAYGAGNLIPPGDYKKISNHVTYLDPVSELPGSSMPGKTEAYFPKGQEPLRNLPDAIRQSIAAQASALFRGLEHGIGNFLKPGLSQQSGLPVKIDAYSPFKQGDLFKLPGSDNFYFRGTGVMAFDLIRAAFQAGLAWFRPRDPLILDLDNDGIELTASNSAVLFDHNADGIKTGSQWARADDGMLVRDLNGNGTIDSGRELFGDQTQISTVNAQGQTVTTLATNGFQALSALDKDANGIADGVFDANDVAYSELKVWRDLNQNGVSQSNELLGLAESGIIAINLVQTAAQTAQGKSTFTKTVSGVDANGNPVTTATTQTVQNVNLTSNTFYRAFSDNPVVSEAAANLPQMQGAGLVRNLREAMSLGNTQAAALAQQVSAFGNASNAQARQAGLETLINAWGATSSLAEARVRTPDAGLGFLGASGSGGGGNVGGGTGAVAFPTGRAVAFFAASDPLLYAKLTALERFNGMPIIERYARSVVGVYFDPSPGWNWWRNYTYYTVVIEAPRRAFFEQAYDALKASVYQSLYLQTAGKELLDQVELVIDPSTGSGQAGLRLGFDALNVKQAICQKRHQRWRPAGKCRSRIANSSIVPKTGFIEAKNHFDREDQEFLASRSRIY